MKTDREFLTSMWMTISETEYEENQKRLVKERSRDIGRIHIVLYSSILCVGAAVILLSLYSKSIYNDGVYGMAFLLLVATYFIDQVYFLDTWRIEAE